MTFPPLPQRVPVALFVFNRPAFTARVLEAIAIARPARLLVVGDGPRTSHPTDVELVRETRALVDQLDWPCEVLTCYSEVNLGCEARISTGLDWVFSHVDEAILLEDDCVPHPTFFSYCEELLDRYRDEARVQMISGCNVLDPAQSGPYSYYFSRCYHIWGWATWSQAWQQYDPDMERWPELRETRWLEGHLRSRTAARVARQLFDQTYGGPVPQWDLKWVLTGWSRDAVSVTPAVNLVTNIGFGEGATHGQDANHPRANLATEPMEFPLRHPPELSVLEEADRAEWELVIPRYLGSQPRGLRRTLKSALRRGQAALGRQGSLRRDRASAG